MLAACASEQAEPPPTLSLPTWSWPAVPHTSPVVPAYDSHPVVVDSGPVSPLVLPLAEAEAQAVADGAAEGYLPPAASQEAQGPFSFDGLLKLYAYAGVQADWHDPLARIALCESSRSTGYADPLAVGDGGMSLGMHQLWVGWFREGENPFDPATNARVAGRVRAVRGRFGGGGGWTCADLLNIP